MTDHAGSNGSDGGGLDPEVLARFKLIADFVNAPDWEQSRAYLEAHPALMEPEMLDSFDEMIEAALNNGNNGMAGHLSIHKDLTRMAAEEGIDAAFSMIGKPPEMDLIALIAQFVNTEDWDQARAVVEANPILLELAAGSAMEALIIAAHEENEPARAQLLNIHRDLLVLIKLIGMDEAFKLVPDAVDEELIKTIADFVYSGGVEDAQKVLEAHPELLEPQVDAVFVQLISDAEDEGQDDFVMLLNLYRKLLSLARQLGIEEAFKKNHTVPPENVMQKMVDFVNATGVTGSRGLLENNPDLLSEEADLAMETLIQAAQGSGQNEMAHHLQVYRNLLTKAREQGIEEAFKHVVTPDKLLDNLVTTTLAVIDGQDQAILQDWLGQLGTYNAQAAALKDEAIGALTNAIARLLLGGDPLKLNPGLSGEHDDAWVTIVEAYRASRK